MGNERYIMEAWFGLLAQSNENITLGGVCLKEGDADRHTTRADATHFPVVKGKIVSSMSCMRNDG